MAKHITKSVIEDIAYELKRAGLWCKNDEAKDYQDNITSPEEMVDYLVQQMAEVFICHDPTFNKEKFLQQCEYKIDQ